MASDLYAQDFIAWTEQQARLLREAGARGTNLPLDWENLAEEVEGVGRSEQRELASQLRRVMLHLLKLDFSPAVDPRAGWRETVREARAAIDGLLRSDPGLRPRLCGLIADEAPTAVRLAAEALRDYGEDASGIIERGTRGSIYSEAQVLDDWFPERPDMPPLRRA